MFNAVVQVAAVQLQLGFTGTAAGTTAAPAAAALAAEGFTQALQTGQLVAQGGQFGLQLALIGGSAGTENFQNQHRAVQHFHLQSGGQVADLAAGEFAVKNSCRSVQILADKPRFGHLALPQQGGGFGGGAFLRNLGHGLHAVGVSQRPQLVQAAGHIVLALVQRQQHDGQFLAVLLFLGRGAKVQIDRILAHRSSFTRW